MTIPYLAGLRYRNVCVVALVLCLCVVMQMLGVPVTVLSVGDIPDEFSGSVLEGFALTQMRVPLTFSFEFISAIELPRPLYILVLVSQYFHPPSQ